MTSVWWCDSFVCECCECECIQIEEIAKKCKTKNRLKEPQKTSLTFKFFCNISSIPRHGDSLKISEDSRKTSSVVIWFAFVYPCVSPEDPEEQKCYFLYYYIKEIYNIKKVFRVFRNITNIHTIKPKHGWRLSREGLQWSSGSSGFQVWWQANFLSIWRTYNCRFIGLKLIKCYGVRVQKFLKNDEYRYIYKHMYIVVVGRS